ncbi:hypothetical protein U9M48_032754 [Paspalum notatum var. saurae]|uniref:Reverse transcriptase zinc-binding domain-containing protein n=1 Tax=Paspalum notatum var. saurae TaxID=547442 RepID=A0AAQ3X5Q3_PASNO
MMSHYRKGKLLSSGGRLVLINSLLSSLPMFIEASKGIIKKLDYYRPLLIVPNVLGGLGILDLEIQNKCLLSKWLFKLLNEDGSWQRLIKKRDSHFWSGLMNVKEQFLSFSSFRTRNGRCVRFWEDQGIGNKTLMEKFPNLYRIVRRKGVTVVSVLNSVPLNVSFRRLLVGDNLASWLELVSKVANVSLTEVQDGVVPRNSILWKLKIPLKIRIFLWYLRSGVILTKDNLAKRKWKGDTKCCFCNETETIQHLFLIVIWQDTFGIPLLLLSELNLQIPYAGLFGYGETMWFSIEDRLTHLHSWFLERLIGSDVGLRCAKRKKGEF